MEADLFALEQERCTVQLPSAFHLVKTRVLSSLAPGLNRPWLLARCLHKMQEYLAMISHMSTIE